MRFSTQGVLVFKQAINKLVAVEQLQMLFLFAHADVFHGYIELVNYPYHYATFGSTVKLGYGQSIYFGSCTKLFALLNGILASAGI